MYQRRKSVAFFIALCLILACFAEAGTVFAEEAAFSSLNTNLTGWTVLNGTWENAGAEGVRGVNPAADNFFAMSNVLLKADQNFTFSADVKLNGKALGLVFGVTDPANPGNNWCSYNLDVGNPDSKLARVFRVEIKDGEPILATQNVVVDIDETQSHNLKVEVISGTIHFYLDGNQIGTLSGSGYDGGYLGIYNLESTALFQNIRYEMIGVGTQEPSGPFGKLTTNLTGLEVISGNWFADENGICGGNAGGGNCFVMSDVRTAAEDSFSFSADISWTGVAAGLAFGIADKQNPEGHWCAFNVDVTEESNLARVFFVSEGELIASSNVTLPDDFNPAETHVFLIEVSEGGYVEFYIDDEWIGELALDMFDVAYTGGYLGIYNVNSNATFQNVQYREGPVNTPKPSEPAESAAPETQSPAAPTQKPTEKPAAATPVPSDSEGEDGVSIGLVVLAVVLGAAVIAAAVLLAVRMRKKEK